MVSNLSLVMIALAVSLDGCGVGLLYGVRKIRIPAVSLIIISICSGLVIYGAMKAGDWLSGWLDPGTARIAGAFILVAIGCFAIVQFFLHQHKDSDEPAKSTAADVPTSRTILHIEIRTIGLVIQIWRSPSVADIDKSGNISPWEASLLGLALSLDAFGAGIGAAMVGYPALPTAALIAVVSGLFVAAGLRLGKLATNIRWMSKLPVLPGILLIVIGIVKLL
jgi:putative sporulation protein YtaF